MYKSLEISSQATKSLLEKKTDAVLRRERERERKKRGISLNSTSKYQEVILCDIHHKDYSGMCPSKGSHKKSLQTNGSNNW